MLISMRWGWLGVAGALVCACSFGGGGSPDPIGLNGTSNDSGSNAGDETPGGPGGSAGTAGGSGGNADTTQGSQPDTGGDDDSMPATDSDSGPVDGTTGQAGDGSSGQPGDSTTGDASSGGQDPTTDDGPGDTGPAVEPYGGCDLLDLEPDCPDAYPECNLSSQCVPSCQSADTCPVPSTGSPQIICGEETEQCYLLCPGGTGCPDGMSCAQTKAVDFCHWPD